LPLVLLRVVLIASARARGLAATAPARVPRPAPRAPPSVLREPPHEPRPDACDHRPLPRDSPRLRRLRATLLRSDAAGAARALDDVTRGRRRNGAARVRAVPAALHPVLLQDHHDLGRAPADGRDAAEDRVVEVRAGDLRRTGLAGHAVLRAPRRLRGAFLDDLL